MKKSVAILLCILLCAVMPLTAYAQSPWDNYDEPQAIPALNPSELALTCKSAILMEMQTGQVIYELLPDEPLPEASITKVMTMLLVFEALDSGRLSLDEIVTCSEHAASMGGSQIWLEPGEQMTVHELIKATMVGSANDAATALAEHIAGSHEGFVALMNARAVQLGMTNTAYRNCTGLDAEGHITSARDIAIVSAELMKHEKVLEYSTIWMDSMRGGQLELVNTNRLIRNYDGANGLKTGTTSQAGCCVAATAERDGMTLIAVVMGAPNSAGRFGDATKLLDFGFASCELLSLDSLPVETPDITVINGVKSSVPTCSGLTGYLLVPKGRAADITAKITCSENIEAPAEAGQQVGTITLSLDGEPVGEYNIVTTEADEAISFGICFGILLEALFDI